METPSGLCQHPRPMLSPLTPASRLLLASAALAVLASLPSFAGADESAPIPAPGEIVPLHAKGGWPNETTGDDKKPPRSAEQQAQLDAVTNELKRLAGEFGPDSVTLQAKFLIRAMGAGAIGPTEVKVAGPSAQAGPGHLEIDVETGLYFDAGATTPESRRDLVWKDVGLPVVDEMVSFRIEPPSLELVFLYNVQELEAGLALEPGAPSTHESFRVRLPQAVLERMIDDRIKGDAVRENAEFTPESVVAATAPPVEH
jgi:hypothetical protein